MYEIKEVENVEATGAYGYILASGASCLATWGAAGLLYAAVCCC